MAINIENDSNNATPAQSAAPQQTQQPNPQPQQTQQQVYQGPQSQQPGPNPYYQQYQQPQPQGPMMNWSFSATELFGAPISRGLGSESLVKLHEKLVDVYKTANPETEMTVINVDRVNEPDLAFSCIVVCMRLKSHANVGVACHLLLLESTGDKLSPVFVNENQQQIELLKVTGDALDKVLVDIVMQKVRNVFPQQPIYIIDGCVVPVNFNLEDKKAVHMLALNAGLSCGTELKVRSPEFIDFNIAAAGQDSSLVINIAFNRQQIEDPVGEPMRSDILLNFVSQRQNQPQMRNMSVNSGAREARVSEISGFIDLVWSPVVQGPMLNPWMQQMPQQTQKYASRLVITNLASNFSYTPAAVLLSLVTALSLRDDNNWIQSFRPAPSSDKEVDLRDIGALNIEANLMGEQTGYGQRIDTKSESFRLEDLGQLVASLIQPGLVISMDVPECGPQTWCLSLFATAANGSPHAMQLIYNAAQSLTNGMFGNHFTYGTPMFDDIGNRVHLGYWVDRNGQRRDIRDIDYLAVANLVGDRNPQMIREWSDTWIANRAPLHVRLAARRKMISALTNESAEFTGFAQRVTFTSIFLDALARGCIEAGLMPRVSTPLSTSDMTNVRGVASFVNSSLIQPGQAFFTNSLGYGNQFTNYQYMSQRYM